MQKLCALAGMSWKWDARAYCKLCNCWYGNNVAVSSPAPLAALGHGPLTPRVAAKAQAREGQWAPREDGAEGAAPAMLHPRAVAHVSPQIKDSRKRGSEQQAEKVVLRGRCEARVPAGGSGGGPAQAEMQAMIRKIERDALTAMRGEVGMPRGGYSMPPSAPPRSAMRARRAARGVPRSR